jgi:2-polyprenyl-3-methyl-5-hydroxy-6-metoxy-1,4-benzoquinol methylase
MAQFDTRDYWERRLKRNYGLEGVGFLRLGKGYNTWLYRLRRSVFLRRMRATGIDFSGAEVLDVGSGTGFYVERWRELGVRKVVGLDLTTVATEQLQRDFPADEFHNVDIGSADLGKDASPLAGRQFDVVSCFDVLFHIVNDEHFETAIENIATLVKPGGLFALSDYFVHPEVMEWSIRAPHRVSRSLDHFHDVLKCNGFEVLQRRPMFVLMNEPVDSGSRLAKARWFAIAGPVAVSNALGTLVGAVVYPLEWLLVTASKESPTTEMMICRKLP